MREKLVEAEVIMLNVTTLILLDSLNLTDAIICIFTVRNKSELIYDGNGYTLLSE